MEARSVPRNCRCQCQCHLLVAVVLVVTLVLVVQGIGVRADKDDWHGDHREPAAAEPGVCWDESTRGACHVGDGADSSEDTAARSKGGDRSGKARSSGDREGDGWDSRGYVTFCPSMGNFGNQIECYLGAFAFAKALNRTLIVPPFNRVGYRSRKMIVPFAELFQLQPLRAFLPALTMEDFLERLAPDHWPPTSRKSYTRTFATLECSQTREETYWRNLSPPVSFAECHEHSLPSNANMDKEGDFAGVRRKWNERYPVEEHPVLALHHPPAHFPVEPGNRRLQKHLHWREEAFAPARAYIEETFGGEPWVAAHLRNGMDWVVACERDLEKQAFIMGSPQCHERKLGAVTKDMCLPSLSHMLNLTLQVFQDVRAKHFFVATDNQPYLPEFKNLLEPLGVSVQYLDPDMPQMDLMVMGQADYFIGSCVSTFTSFVKRERDVNGKASIFWGQEYLGFQ